MELASTVAFTAQKREQVYKMLVAGFDWSHFTIYLAIFFSGFHCFIS